MPMAPLFDTEIGLPPRGMLTPMASEYEETHDSDILSTCGGKRVALPPNGYEKYIPPR